MREAHLVEINEVQLVEMQEIHFVEICSLGESSSAQQEKTIGKKILRKPNFNVNSCLHRSQYVEND